MPKLIIISGTPAIGKEKLAKKLSKKLKIPRLDLHYHYADISSTYNRSKKCYDVDIKKFLRFITSQHPLI